MATTPAKKSSSAARLPIADYDRLSIKQILPLLMTLSGPELKAVTKYEKSFKNRVTLLRAVRKVELAREATIQAPASHLSVVDDDEELDGGSEWADEPTSVGSGSDWADDDEDDEAGSGGGWIEDEPATTSGSGWAHGDADSGSDSDADSEWAAPGYETGSGTEWGLDDFGPDFAADPEPQVVAKVESDFEPKPEPDFDSESAPESEQVAVASAIPAPPAILPSAPKRRRNRQAAKAATWEEEPRVQLPRRFESSSLDLEPPVIAIVPEVAEAPMPFKVTSDEGQVEGRVQGAHDRPGQGQVQGQVQGHVQGRVQGPVDGTGQGPQVRGSGGGAGGGPGRPPRTRHRHRPGPR